jgi:Nucleotidyltransferase
MPKPAIQTIELSENQRRQYIDGQAVLGAYGQALAEAAQLKGSMLWRDLRGVCTLIRTSSSGAQHSLGPDSPELRQMYDKFMARKASALERKKSLAAQMLVQRKLNKVYQVGRTPQVVVRILQTLAQAGLAEHFMTVGTHAMYAYESACGVVVGSAALATRDMDLLFDTRKRLSFVSSLQRMDTSLVGLLQKADKSFKVRRDQLQTAVNSTGFEVDIIRRQAKDRDPHPLRMRADEDDFWAVQVPSGDKMLSARKFEQMVVSTLGDMATMHTLHPLDFIRIKQALSANPQRDPLKRPKDLLQAQTVQHLWDEWLQYRGAVA